MGSIMTEQKKPKEPGKNLNQSFSYSFAITNPRKVLYLFCALNAVSYSARCVASAKAAFALVRAFLNFACRASSSALYAFVRGLQICEVYWVSPRCAKMIFECLQILPRNAVNGASNLMLLIVKIWFCIRLCMADGLIMYVYFPALNAGFCLCSPASVYILSGMLSRFLLRSFCRIVSGFALLVSVSGIICRCFLRLLARNFIPVLLPAKHERLTREIRDDSESQIRVFSAIIVRQLRNPMQRYDEHFTFSKFFRKKIQKKCIFFILCRISSSYNFKENDRGKFTNHRFTYAVWVQKYAII